MSVPADAANKSTQTFVTALVVNAAVAGIEVGVFMLIRRKFKKIYEPRTFLPRKKDRVEELNPSFLGWITAVIYANPRQIIAKNGLDAYVFLRYLRMMLLIFAPIMCLALVVLMPVDAAGSGGERTGLDRFTFGNVGTSPQQQRRYAAHLIMTYIFTFYIFYLIKREMGIFVEERHRFLISPEHAALAQSKTVLVTGVPKEYFDSSKFAAFLKYLPGGVTRTWYARDLKEMPDIWNDRNKACSKLESAETNLIKTANKLVRKKKVTLPTEADTADVEKDVSLAERLVPKKKRPTHRVSKLPIPIPFVGKKVDTIDWCREEIAKKNKELDEMRGDLTKYNPQQGIFIQFQQQIAAHMFAQSTSHHRPLRMSLKYLDVAPKDVVWGNLNVNPYEQRGRYAASWAMTIGLIITWAFPVAFVGLISNVSELCVKAPWLRWLCNLPVPINGIIQGVLPPVALAVLFMFLPIILRLFARFEGIPLRSVIELSLMKRYFIFLVIHGFLIVTLASGLIAALPQIANQPSQAVQLLAQKLPTASNFFLTYLVTTGLSGAAGGLLQIGPLIVYYVKLVLLGSTPRSVYNIKNQMPGVQWGTLFPNMTLLMVIGLAYSVISPLVNIFALLAFALFWFTYKYLFIWVYDMPKEGETGGLFFPTAIQHLFVGLYIEQICLTGLFFLAQDAQMNQSAIPEGALMVVLIVITVLFHILINSGYYPIIKYLPISLADRIEQSQHASSSDVEKYDSRPDGVPVVRDGATPASEYPPHAADMVPVTSDKGKSIDHSSSDGESGQTLHAHAFDHPSTWEKQPIVWLPKDPTGLGEQETKLTREAGVDVSDAGANMTEKGKVDVSKAPPGEEWDDDVETASH